MKILLIKIYRHVYVYICIYTGQFARVTSFTVPTWRRGDLQPHPCGGMPRSQGGTAGSSVALSVPPPPTGLSHSLVKGHVFHLLWGIPRTGDAQNSFSPTRDGAEENQVDPMVTEGF